MDKKRYDEMVELYERLEAAEKLFGSRYGDLKKVDGKFYWKRFINFRWIRDKYRRTISREVPSHWNWSELEPLDCARLFAQGDLPFYYSSSNNDEHDSVGRKIFGDEVWNEASRLFDEDEDGVDYVEWSDLEESTPLIFPEPEPLPCVEDLHDSRREWILPDEEDFTAYLKGEKEVCDFKPLVYCPATGSLYVYFECEEDYWQVFPVLEGKEWSSYVADTIGWLTYKEDDDELEDLDPYDYKNWSESHKSLLWKRYCECNIEYRCCFCDGGYEDGIMCDLVSKTAGIATMGRYW